MKKTLENPLTYNKIYTIRGERQHTQGKVVLGMTAIAKQTVELLEMLPEQAQELANALIKRMVLAWDSDFTKLTPAERQRLELAEQEIEAGETVSHDEIDWN